MEPCNASGDAAITGSHSDLVRAFRHCSEPTVALVRERVWNQGPGQLDERTRMFFREVAVHILRLADAGRLPSLESTALLQLVRDILGEAPAPRSRVRTNQPSLDWPEPFESVATLIPPALGGNRRTPALAACHDALLELPPADRRLLQRRFAQGFTLAELAAGESTSTADVRRRLANCVQRLDRRVRDELLFRKVEPAVPLRRSA